MDQLDRKLLNAFQGNTRQTTNALGDEIGLSATACQRRLNRMRKEGVIEKEVAILNPKKVDRSMTLIVEVILERGDSALIAAFKRKVHKLPEVAQCYYVTGRADFFMIVTMRDMEEYDEFTRDVFFDDPAVKSFETSTVMDRTKVGFSLPLLEQF